MNLQDYIDQGGVIVLVLIAMLGLGSAIMLWKSLSIGYIRLRGTYLCRGCKEKLPQESDIAMVELVVHDTMHTIEKGLGTVRIIATIAPLLGLLGTVIGIFSAFQGIAAHGLGDPSYFAEGISMAMITTIAGLIVAIPHYIGYNYLVGMMDRLELAFTQELYTRLRKSDA